MLLCGIHTCPPSHLSHIPRLSRKIGDSELQGGSYKYTNVGSLLDIGLSGCRFSVTSHSKCLNFVIAKSFLKKSAQISTINF